MFSYFRKEPLLCFDDLVCIPQYSKIESRSQVDTSVKISKNGTDYHFSTPIVSSPMSNVTDIDMCVAMDGLNSMAILHRFSSFEDRLNKVRILKNIAKSKFIAVAVGVKEEDYLHLPQFIDAGVNCICVDVAHGVTSKVFKFIEHAKKLIDHTDIILIAGSISNHYHVLEYEKRGLSCDGYRVGIGGGSICTTTIQTGHGQPLASSLESFYKREREYFIIADGGIRNSGDMVKSLALGAKFVMCGSLLAGVNESNAEIIVNERGEKFKKYFGMASLENQKNKDSAYEEGVSHFVRCEGPLSEKISGLMNGIRSGCSYSGIDKISELEYFAHIEQISGNALTERKPHVYNL